MKQARGAAAGSRPVQVATSDEPSAGDERRPPAEFEARAERIGEGELGRRPAQVADWRVLLAGASPREVLARLTSGDPLALRGVVAARLSEQALLLDADRVWLRAVARVARFSTRYRGEPALERWLCGQVDDAILDCLESGDSPPHDALDGATTGAATGAGASSAGRGATRPAQRDASNDAAGEVAEDSRTLSGQIAGSIAGQGAGRSAAGEPRPASIFEALARPLGLSASRMRAACEAFNACELPERRAFFALVLERADLEASAARLRLSPTECARAARRALEAVMEAALQSTRPATPGAHAAARVADGSSGGRGPVARDGAEAGRGASHDEHYGRSLDRRGAGGGDGERDYEGDGERDYEGDGERDYERGSGRDHERDDDSDGLEQNATARVDDETGEGAGDDSLDETGGATRGEAQR